MHRSVKSYQGAIAHRILEKEFSHTLSLALLSISELVSTPPTILVDWLICRN
jgi:hypothetical protein